MKQQLVKISKFLSLVLRHRPEKIGVSLDSQGWLDIDVLIENSNAQSTRLTRELILEVVANNDKKRFAISEDGKRIRANQGHSIETIELCLDARVPPEVLYHGTITSFLPPIQKEGLLKMQRNHVHLSADVETAEIVGQRRGKPIVLQIDAQEMHQQGFEFFLSANHVWLTEQVPPDFIVVGTRIA